MSTDKIQEPIMPADVDEAVAFEALGPHYFSARRFADDLTNQFTESHFKPLLDEFAKAFNDKLWTTVEDSLIADTSSNVQSHIWRTVDQIVQGILSGERWVVDRYALGERYDCEKARATIAKHVPKELQDARIADLESELTRLKEQLRWYTERNQ